MAEKFRMTVLSGSLNPKLYTMKKRENLVVVVLCFLTATRLLGASGVQSPNIIFIYADDMGWTGTSVEMMKGHAETKSDFYLTPHLKTLAAKGMVFSQAYSPGPMCTPSRAAVLTGRTPAELHITSPGGGGRADTSRKVLTPRSSTQLPRDGATIGTALKKAGYATALLGKWHIGRTGHAGEYGFDLNDGPTQNDSKGTAEDPKSIFSLTKRGIEFMEKSVEAKQPFYLQLSHYAVHGPSQSRDKSMKKFQEVSPGKVHRDAVYAGMTWDLDRSLSEIFDAVKKLDISDKTYLVFMSDNGARGNRRMASNVPLNGGKGTLFEGGIRIPFMVSGPEIEVGHCAVPVSGIDLFATFAAWTGVEVQLEESEDLTPLLKGRATDFKRRKDLFFHYPHYGQGVQVPQSALVIGDWKLLRDWEAGSDRLFDLKKDIGESVDLSAKHPEVFESMVKKLDARLKETNAQIPSKNESYDPESQPMRRQRKRR